ncbi:hypothetical protein GCM10022223_33070 [Kineosporia mesophila]|uniref:Uncharacterized protein n=1 Tax=Kineosporia mesophila TaxID=566012 RepID=A0ABP6ZMQ5_9ACTN|nr:hypothetical protein [Kineosporia mesophila]MCD5353699.1 hypothetical protein [Kineosporia mesophila]
MKIVSQASARARTPRLITGTALAVCAGLSLSGMMASGITPARASTRAVQAVTPATTEAVQPFTVHLLTGERLRVSGTPGQPVIAAEKSVRGGAPQIITYTSGPDTYAVPTSALPYLGRYLDLSLFDVAQAQGSSGRVPVRLAYHGARPSIPGLTLTSAASGHASGYLTRTSSFAFGRALTAAWKSDSGTGTTVRGDALFAGISRIESAAPAGAQLAPSYPMVTLKVKVTNVKGKPMPSGLVAIASVDKGRKTTITAMVDDGVARISIPKGNYSAAIWDSQFNSRTQKSTMQLDTVSDYSINRTMQTLKLDLRRATSGRTTVSVPRPVAPASPDMNWQVLADGGSTALETGPLNLMDGDALDIRWRPTEPPVHGKQQLILNWQLKNPAGQPNYRYTVAALEDHAVRDPSYVFTDADLHTVTSTYVQDRWTKQSRLLRLPSFALSRSGGGALEPTTPKGTRQVEYAGAYGGEVEWFETAMQTGKAPEAIWADSQNHTLPAGASSEQVWFRGPLTPGIPDYHPTKSISGITPFCSFCRAGRRMALVLNTGLDAAGNLNENYQNPGSSQLYRNGKLIASGKDRQLLLAAVSPGRATYRAVFDVDRSMESAKLASHSRSVYTFASKKATTGRIPSGFVCLIGKKSECQTLPVLQAHLDLPLDDHNELPIGHSPISLHLAQVQNAPASPIITAGLKIRPAGSTRWTTVALASQGDGTFTGVVDTGKAGSTVDIQLTGSDRAGSTVSQTITNAYAIRAAR